MFNSNKAIKKLMSTNLPFDNTTGEFNQIDVGLADKTLQITKRAKELGAKGLPTELDKSKDEVYSRIDLYINSAIQETKSLLSNYLDANSNLNNNQFDEDKILDEAQMEAESCDSTLNRVGKNGENKLYKYKENLHLVEKELKEFRDKNKLIGPAKYPSPSEKTIGLLFIFAMFIVEVFLNTYMLGGAHPSGYVGVMVDVLFFGFINISIAYAWGRGVIPQLRHVSFFRKLFFGLTGSLIFFAVIVFLNLFFAHYRDAISALEVSNFSLSEFNNLGRQTFDNLKKSPLELNDTKSFLLWGGGIIIACFTAYKAFSLDDPYPRYGKLQRKYNQISSEYSDECDFILEDINNIVYTFKEEYERKIYSLESQYRSSKKRTESHNVVLQKYKDWLQHIEAAGVTLYSINKNENMLARRDGVNNIEALNRIFELPKIALNIDETFTPKHLNSLNIKEISRFYNEKFQKLNDLLRQHSETLNSSQNLGASSDYMAELDKKTSEVDLIKLRSK